MINGSMEQRKILKRSMEHEKIPGARGKIKQEQGAQKNEKRARKKVQKEQGAKNRKEQVARGELPQQFIPIATVVMFFFASFATLMPWQISPKICQIQYSRLPRQHICFHGTGFMNVYLCCPPPGLPGNCDACQSTKSREVGTKTNPKTLSLPLIINRSQKYPISSYVSSGAYNL